MLTLDPLGSRESAITVFDTLSSVGSLNWKLKRREDIEVGGLYENINKDESAEVWFITILEKHTYTQIIH